VKFLLQFSHENIPRVTLYDQMWDVISYKQNYRGRNTQLPTDLDDRGSITGRRMDFFYMTPHSNGIRVPSILPV
jgi:hypothetical protein